MGIRIRRFLTHVGAIVYDYLRFPACADERGRDNVGFLPQTRPPRAAPDVSVPYIV